MHWIKNRFPLPFHHFPPWHALCNHQLDNLQQAFIDNEIEHLLVTGVICQASPSELLFLHPLGAVPKKNRTMHMIIDMHLLNSFLNPPWFKYDSLGELAPMLCPGDWHLTINFHNSFHHIKVMPHHQSYLRFTWKGRQHCFKVLPFSLSVSPWGFMHFIQATVHHLHHLGLQALTYMDDLIVMAPSKIEAFQAHKTTLCLLHSLGWQVNWEKSSLNPSQTNKFLGHIVDTMGEP